MKFCPECGKPLHEEMQEDRIIHTCECGFVDWDNWVNVCCMAVGFNEKHEVLLVTLKGAEEGRVTFPGGFRNLGETLEEAAQRECLEESGYRIEELKVHRIYTNDRRRLVWIVYLGKITGGAFSENAETRSARFHSRVDLPASDSLRGPIAREILGEFAAGKI